MYLSIFIYLLLSLTISSINGSNHYLDNLDSIDFSQYPNEQNYENKQNEKSYLEKLEEKINYENELSKLEELLTSKEYLNDNQENDPKNDDIDEYLKYQSTNLLPAFNTKELNNQKINLPELDYLKDLNHLNHHITTMPTELRNKLMSGPRLRRVYKKSPIAPAVLFDNYQNEDEIDPNQEKYDQLIYQSTGQLNEPVENEIKEDKNEKKNINEYVGDNLNKEIDLEELTKYLMAKRTQVKNLTVSLPNNAGQQNDTGSDSKSSSNSSKESKDNSKESKEDDSKESKESSDSSQTKEKEPPVNNVSTELKKTIITQQNGKAIKKVETYKKSYVLSQPSFMNDESDSYFVNPPINVNLEKILHEANMPNPILVKQRNSVDRYENGHLIRTKSRISFGDIYFIGIVIACSMVSILSVAGAGYCFYRFQQHNKATQDVEYPAYGIIGPAFKSSQDDDSSPRTKKNPLTQESLVNKSTNINHQSILSQDAVNTGSDRKLAQSAQMYHYHHQKQQMILTEKNKNMRNTSASDVESDEENEENEEGDYTVYECPGLATNLGEIEITNPNFQHENVDEKTDEKKTETDSKK